MRRWLGMLVVIGLVLGCAGMWDDVADFFDSGFADDDDGDGGGGDELTTENLEGSWELDLEASDIDDDTRLTTDNLAGTWNVSGELPNGFLSEFSAEIASATAVRIDQNTFTFQTEVTDDTDPVLDYVILDTDTVELTEGDQTKRVQVGLATSETTPPVTTLTMTDGTDDGIFTFENHPTVDSYDLTITETQFTTIIERSSGSTTTITETYEILADEQQIRLTAEGTTDTTVVDAALSSDGDRLTLTYPDEAGGGTGVFNRVESQEEEEEETTP